MLRADLMKRTYNPALEQAPNALNRICMHVIAYPLFGAVVHCLMRCVFIGYAQVGRVLIGHQAFGLWMSRVFDESVKDRSVCFLSAFYPQPDRSATFDRTQYHRFVVQVSAANVPFLSLCENGSFRCENCSLQGGHCRGP